MLQAIFCWHWWPSGRFLRYGIFCATAPAAAVEKNPAENHAAAAVSTAINNDERRLFHAEWRCGSHHERERRRREPCSMAGRKQCILHWHLQCGGHYRRRNGTDGLGDDGIIHSACANRTGSCRNPCESDEIAGKSVRLAIKMKKTAPESANCAIIVPKILPRNRIYARKAERT